jgi:very-short-patch-repair endonuclease
MGLRLTADQALKMNLISADDAKAMKAACATASRARGARAKTQRTSGRAGSTNLQERLFNALKTRLPQHDIRYDEKGLIPGRKFRADIYIVPDTIVEMDGYQFHSDRNTFQSDRQRNNLFAAAGFRMFHAYAKQVHDPQLLSELVELIARTVTSTAIEQHTINEAIQ